MRTFVHLCLCTMLALPCLAFADEELELMLEFGIKQKSTAGSFHLQEVSSDELSDMAIAGGLGAAVSSGTRSAHAEQNQAQAATKEKRLNKQNAGIPDFAEYEESPELPATLFAHDDFPIQQVNSSPLGNDFQVIQDRSFENNNVFFER